MHLTLRVRWIYWIQSWPGCFHVDKDERARDRRCFLLLSNLNFASRAGKSSQSGSLQVEYAGRRIPQAAVLDLKTRSAWRVTNVPEEELPRLWVAQIPHFILARHVSGVFHEIQISEVSQKVKEWQQDSQKGLRQLVSLLQKIISAVKERTDKKLEVRCKSV